MIEYTKYFTDIFTLRGKDYFVNSDGIILGEVRDFKDQRNRKGIHKSELDHYTVQTSGGAHEFNPSDNKNYHIPSTPANYPKIKISPDSKVKAKVGSRDVDKSKKAFQMSQLKYHLKEKQKKRSELAEAELKKLTKKKNIKTAVIGGTGAIVGGGVGGYLANKLAKSSAKKKGLKPGTKEYKRHVTKKIALASSIGAIVGGTGSAVISHKLTKLPTKRSVINYKNTKTFK